MRKNRQTNAIENPTAATPVGVGGNINNNNKRLIEITFYKRSSLEMLT